MSDKGYYLTFEVLPSVKKKGTNGEIEGLETWENRVSSTSD